MRKQAILIMAHNKLDQLKILLGMLDSDCFDIFLHMDAKFGDVPVEQLESCLNDSTLHVLSKRWNVTWGAPSILRCELDLIAAAVGNGDYSYYHLISGQDLPLHPAREIAGFFDSHYGSEFVGYQWVSTDPAFPKRVRRRFSTWHPFSEADYHNGTLGDVALQKVDNVLSKIQMAVGIDRGKGKLFGKGAQWFSITDRFAGYLLEHKDEIEAEFIDRTILCDEVFVQSILIRSPFNEARWQDGDEHRQCMRLIDWERGTPYTWRMENLDELLSSDMMFARKFDRDVDSEVILELEKRING